MEYKICTYIKLIQDNNLTQKIAFFFMIFVFYVFSKTVKSDGGMGNNNKKQKKWNTPILKWWSFNIPIGELL